MKFRNLALAAAALVCCISCIDKDNQLGGNLVPIGQTYKFYTADIPIDDIYMKMADSLSGYSSTRVTVGAIRDEDYGLTTRSSVITLIPMFVDDVDWGSNPEFQSFHFAMARDTVAVSKPDQINILQGINVYELSEPLDEKVNFDCNKPVNHGSSRISKGSILYNGADSLSFDFTSEFGKKYMGITSSDLTDIDSYLKKFPGIVLESDEPIGNGGRINMFDLQLGYDSDYEYLTGNYAKLNFRSTYDGERKDTCLYFYYGATDLYDIDSLLTNGTVGQYPEYCLNLTTQQTRSRAGKASDKIYVEGGGGLKPSVSAKMIKNLVEKEIASKGGDPKYAVINKATLVMPFEFPSDISEMDYWPQILSPTCRMVTDTTATFMGLTDSSSDDENQGDINRSIGVYQPDITFHVQELLKIDESKPEATWTKYLNNGSYDIWFLIMANETTTTTSSTSSDLSEMYQYLAYQSYYSSMYGGYSSGYGSGYDSYTNYYNYQMLAAYASQSQTYTSTSSELDKDRWYHAVLNGPATSNGPHLKLVYALPVEY